MPILKDGAEPIAVRRIGRDLKDSSVKRIVLIDDNGIERNIWDGTLRGHLVIFKSFDGSTTYSKRFYLAGQAVQPPQIEAAGWSTVPNSATGIELPIVATANDETYYEVAMHTILDGSTSTAAFEVVKTSYGTVTQSGGTITVGVESNVGTGQVACAYVPISGAVLAKYNKITVSYSVTNHFTNNSASRYIRLSDSVPTIASYPSVLDIANPGANESNTVTVNLPAVDVNKTYYFYVWVSNVQNLNNSVTISSLYFSK